MGYNGKIIDIHTHIQPADVILDRGAFFEEEPDFRLLYENPKYRLSTCRDVLEEMDEFGIDSSVILGFAWRNRNTLRMHNDLIIEESRNSEGRLFGFTCVYPFGEGSAAGREAERTLDAGAAGIGEVGLYDRDLDREYIEAMAPVMKVCRERGRPVMMHVNEPVGHSYSGKAPMSVKGIYNFVKAYPDNRIILAHWGGGLLFFSLLKKEAKDVLRNVWYDSAASPYLYEPSIWKTAVEIVGAEKVLFGTDFPLLDAERYIEQLELSGFKEDVLKKILFENAFKLLQSY